jgi:Ethylbenzene dehydrogenase
MRQLLKTRTATFCEKVLNIRMLPRKAPVCPRSKRKSVLVFLLFAFLALPGLNSPSVARCETRLTAVKVGKKPIIDGYRNDPAWKQAPEIITHDPIANLDVALKAVHTGKEIFFLVRFADPEESRIHKAWVWSAEKSRYEIGPLREDCFVFKWAMDGSTTDLSIRADEEYTADLWFWKANRTDPAGFADDKFQGLGLKNIRGWKPVLSRTGKTMFLKRKGDAGKPAYKNQILIEYAGEIKPQFLSQTPSGSRADIRAKGLWSDREWCIEFSRKLVTGHSDDVQFEVGKEFLFGISRNEIAGSEPDPNISQPLYGAGDVSERLILVFGN